MRRIKTAVKQKAQINMKTEKEDQTHDEPNTYVAITGLSVADIPHVRRFPGDDANTAHLFSGIAADHRRNNNIYLTKKLNY